MSFFNGKQNKRPSHGQKLPPVSAFGHYQKKQGNKIPRFLPAEKEAPPYLAVHDLSLGYEGRKIIEKLNFSVRAGDYLCVVGENGSGKSTLMGALLGLIKPMSGSITYIAIERHEIGTLPQITPVQNDFPATVREVVLSGCSARSKGSPLLPRNAKKIAFSNMEKLGITALEGRPFRVLSGGQRQRVLLCRALCAADKMLLLDEPTTGLDPAATADIYALLEDLNRQGITIVTVTHDIPAALRYSDHILHIRSDSYFFGSTEEYKILPEVASYLRKQEKTVHPPYGEVGFRYKGGEEQ